MPGKDIGLMVIWINAFYLRGRADDRKRSVTVRTMLDGSVSICVQNGNQEYDEIIEAMDMDREVTIRIYPGAGPRPNAS